MKKIFIIILIAVIAAAGGYYYINHKPHRDISAEEALKVKASELFKAYEVNEKKANELYLNKVVEVSGELGEILEDKNGAGIFILKGEGDFFGVKCSLLPDQKEKSKKYKEGDIVKVKGLCTGGGGGLDVELVKCSLME